MTRAEAIIGEKITFYTADVLEKEQISKIFKEVRRYLTVRLWLAMVLFIYLFTAADWCMNIQTFRKP